MQNSDMFSDCQQLFNDICCTMTHTCSTMTLTCSTQHHCMVMMATLLVMAVYPPPSAAKTSVQTMLRKAYIPL
jgi:hypothetical protein